jgi:hypothetical protein
MPLFLKLFLRIIASKPEKPARMLSRLAINPMYQNSNGRFYKFDGREIKSSPYSYDAAIQEKLWETSSQIEKSLSKRVEHQEAVFA